ncbi:MAG: DUF4332 domain-containing protein [Candidatus Thorarchaeota archaeon]|jgi:hypothetical protein
MDEDGLRTFLRKKRKTTNTIERSLEFTRRFRDFLAEFRGGVGIEGSTPEDLEEFVTWLEENNESPNIVLWGVRFYFDFAGRKPMATRASELRQSRIRRKEFLLSEFRGVSEEHSKKLRAIGIENVSEMLVAGRTKASRQELAERSDIPLEVVEELTLLSDLARIPGVKAIRARLYYDAGVETLDKLAEWDPLELRSMLTVFIEESGFDGVPPWPKEARGAVETARSLPRILDI